MLMTPEEFDAVTDYDDRFVYELIHGVLIVSPPPGECERGPNETLAHWLLTFREQSPQGTALDATLPEHTISIGDNRRRADRAIWCGLGRQPRLETDIPSIVAEFVSKRKRDRVRDYEEKRREYLEIGVVEYWIIDRFARTMTVYKSATGEQSEVVIKAEETYRTPLLPGFELPLALLLKAADDWAGSATRQKIRASKKP
jgi:Uma2 family endonuclease